MTTTPNMSLAMPVTGPAGSVDIWGDLLNAIFPLIDAHDHTSGKGVRIPSSGLNPNADLMFASGGENFSITDLLATCFAPSAAADVTSYTSALWVNAANSDLYFRNAGGTDIQLTSGNTINMTLVGGVGGDYAAVGALISFDDATDTFLFKQELANSTRQYGKIKSASISIFEYLAAGDPTTPANSVTIKSPAGLGAAYTITLPTAVPASTAPLMMSAAGVLTPSLAPSIAGPWQGTDFLYTGAQGITLPASLALDRLGTHTKNTGGTSGATNRVLLAASALPLVWELPVRNGDIITALTVYAQKNTNNTNSLTARLYKTSGETGTETALGTGATNSANAPGFIVLSESSLSITVDDTSQFYLVVTPGGGVTPAADNLYHGVVYVKRA